MVLQTLQKNWKTSSFENTTKIIKYNNHTRVKIELSAKQFTNLNTPISHLDLKTTKKKKINNFKRKNYSKEKKHTQNKTSKYCRRRRRNRKKKLENIITYLVDMICTIIKLSLLFYFTLKATRIIRIYLRKKNCTLGREIYK